MSKGRLEVTIYQAYNLRQESPLNSFVKIYLRNSTQKLHKRQTKTIYDSLSPKFNTTLYYNACDVLGRNIQLIIIKKMSALDKNKHIGEVFIQLKNLDLTCQTADWYKVYEPTNPENIFHNSF
jgi:Ca2+-dependent lipid-binding protein